MLKERRERMGNLLRYRAWDKTHKKLGMIDAHMTDGLFQSVKIFDEDGDDWQESENFILMQSTGLKDKNGTEIFEDDVLKNNDYPNQTFICKYSMLQASFQAESLNGLLTSSLWKDEERDWQVLGNIYENPELLEADNDTK